MITALRSVVRARSGIAAIAQTVVANVLVQAANILSGVLTARTLGPSGRGALAAIIMWPQFLAYGLTMGVPVATIYWLKKRPDLSAEITGASMTLSVALGLIAALIGAVIIPFSLHTYPPHVIHFAQIWVLVTPLALGAVTITSQVQSAGAFTNFNLFRFFSPLSVLLVIVLEKLTGHLTIFNAAVAYLLAGTPATIWIATWVWKHYRPTLANFKIATRLLLGYGVRAWGADLLGTIASQIDRILVVGLLNPQAMGLYVVAQSAAGVLAVLPNAVSPVSMPKSSGKSEEEILDLTGRAARMTAVVMVAAALPLVAFGGILLSLVYGQKFSGAYAVLPFLVVESILDGLTSVLSQAFLAAGHPGTVAFLQGTGLLTSIPLLYWLVPRYGIRGAGCALMLSTAFRFAFILANFPLQMKVRPPSLLIGKQEFMTLLARLQRSANSTR